MTQKTNVLRSACILSLPTMIMATALGLAACDPGRGVEVISCAASDEVLQIGLRDPKRAAQGLRKIADGARSGDRESIEKAADILIRVSGCIEGQR